jgi:hypothetical protein
MMTKYICETCGTQYPDSDTPPEHCPICEDERQYIGLNGQQWTTLEQLQTSRRNAFYELEPGVTAIEPEPRFAIGQRALLIETPTGNILWDCVSLIDDVTIDQIQKLGGISKIAISHPHYYSIMGEWSKEFDAPIFIHSDEREWVMQPNSAITFWESETYDLDDGLTLIRCGGHFSGGQVLHWRDGAEGKGVLLSGDTIQVVPDRRWVSFMYSYPNLIPLPPSQVRRIVAAVEPYEFDRIYSPWRQRDIKEDAKGAVRRSMERYIAAITE